MGFAGCGATAALSEAPVAQAAKDNIIIKKPYRKHFGIGETFCSIRGGQYARAAGSSSQNGTAAANYIAVPGGRCDFFEPQVMKSSRFLKKGWPPAQAQKLF